MKSKIKKFFTFLLVTVMILSTGVLQAFAAGESKKDTDEIKRPKLHSETEDSILLQTEKGFIYAIQITKDEEKVWQWAEDEQYDKDEKTVVFKDLKADTEYVFACKKDEAEDVLKEDIQTYKTKAVNDGSDVPESIIPESKTPETTPPESKTPETAPPESKTPETAPPESKTPETAPPESKTPETAPPESKTPETAPPESKTPESTPPKLAAPINKAVRPATTTVPPSVSEMPVLVSATTNPAIAIRFTVSDTFPQAFKTGCKFSLNHEASGTSYNLTGSDVTFSDNTLQFGAYTCTLFVDAGTYDGYSVDQPLELGALSFNLLKPAPDAPDAPVLDQKTDTSIFLKADANTEYALLTEGAVTGSWTSNGQFTSLIPDTAYQFVARIKGDETTEPGKLSAPVQISTLKTAAPAPDAPKVIERTDTAITLEAQPNTEYALKNGSIIGEWTTAPVFSQLAPATQYEFVARTVFDPSVSMPSNISGTLAVSTKKSPAPPCSAPVLSSRTDTAIILEAGENQEFAIISGNTAGSWQRSPEFSQLKPNTTYQFAARTVFNPDEAMPSEVSQTLTAKTVIAFNGSAITGVAQDGVYSPNTELTAAAVGNGMDNVNPEAGDTRWVPDSWHWGGKALGRWKEAPYSVKFSLKTVGKYRLTVNYRLEEYRDGKWTSMNQSNSTAVEFRVKEAPLTQYTITATGGSGGKISPSGNITVDSGKNAAFKITPDKDYQIAKVYIDGKAVKIKDSQYTFTKVTANHTISVTFEKAGKLTSPKTGDDRMILPVWIIAVLSWGIIGLIFLKAKRNKKISG